MFEWSDIGNFEVVVTVFMVAFWILGLSIYGRLKYLIRLKEIELRNKGLLDDEE